MANGLNLGGLVGTNYGLITDSYTHVNITGGSSAVGGLIGQGRGVAINSYAAGSINSAAVSLGGLIGENFGTVLGSYYDSATTGQTDTSKGMPKTTVEMQQQATFLGWNFGSIWAIDAGGYPYLRWAAAIIEFILSYRGYVPGILLYPEHSSFFWAACRS